MSVRKHEWSFATAPKRDGSGYSAAQASVHREEESVLYLAVVQFLLKETCLLSSDTFELIKIGLAILSLFS